MTAYTMGSRLKGERERLGFTQLELSRFGGVEPSTLSKYENNRSSPDAECLRRLSEAGIDVMYVLRGNRRNTGLVNDWPEKFTAHLVDVHEALQQIPNEPLADIDLLTYLVYEATVYDMAVPAIERLAKKICWFRRYSTMSDPEYRRFFDFWHSFGVTQLLPHQRRDREAEYAERGKKLPANWLHITDTDEQ